LEDRRLLSFLTVNTFADDDPSYAPGPLTPGRSKNFTLRDAVLQANYDAAHFGFVDTIDLPYGTYDLSIANPCGADKGGFALDITASVNIVGSYNQEFGDPTYIHQTQQDRVFEITTPGIKVSLSGQSDKYSLVISGGCAVDQENPTGPATGPDYALGGGIYNDGANLTLNDVVLGYNQAVGSNGTGAGGNGETALGGGIYSVGGRVMLTNSQISVNAVYGGNGAAGMGNTPGGAGGSAEGGGLFACDGAAVIPISNGTDCFDYNQATAGNGGAGGGDASGGTGGSAFGGGLCLAYSSISNAMSPALFSPCLEEVQVLWNSVYGGAGGAAGSNNSGAGGRAAGGSICALNFASVRLTNANVCNNDATGGINALGASQSYGKLGGFAVSTPEVGGLAFGGGIATEDSNLTLFVGLVLYNQAVGGDSTGDPSVGASGGEALGGGIGFLGHAALNMYGTSVGYDDAQGGEGGAVTAASLSGYGGYAFGGGLAIAPDVPMGESVLSASADPGTFASLTNVQIVDNQANGGSGGPGVAARGGEAGGGGGGGMFYDLVGPATFTNLAVSGNTAQRGNGGNGANGGENGANGENGGLGGPAEGGGLFGNGAIILNGGFVNKNWAIGGAGGNGGSGGNGGGGNYGAGGALACTFGTVRLSGVQVNSNSATGGNGGNGGNSTAIAALGGAGGEGFQGAGGALVLDFSTAVLTLRSLSDNTARGGAGGTGGQGGPGNYKDEFLYPGQGGPGGSGGEADGGALYEVGGDTTLTASLTITILQVQDNLAQGGSGGNGGPEGYNLFPNGSLGAGGTGGNAYGGVAYVQSGATLNLDSCNLVNNFFWGGTSGQGDPWGSSGGGANGQYYSQTGATVNKSRVTIVGGD
jgi:hypothetical protein